jgi:hypothetical protein
MTHEHNNNQESKVYATEYRLSRGNYAAIPTENWDSLSSSASEGGGVCELAEISIPGKEFKVVDLRDAQPTEYIGGRAVLDMGGTKVALAEKMPFALISKSKDGKVSVRGIRSGREPVVIGRSDPKSQSRFDLSDPRISSEHFKIGIDINGSLLVQDNSLNGTTLRIIDRSFGDTIRPSSGESSGSAAEHIHEKDIEPELDPRLESFSERIRKLASPLSTDSRGVKFNGRSGDLSESNFDYRILFEESDEEANARHEKYMAEQRSRRPEPKRDRVSVQTLESAQKTLEKSVADDGLLRSIIDEYAQSDNIIDELRGNHPLRCAVLNHFQEKLYRLRIDRPQELPERVRWDSPGNLKKPNSDGYPVDSMLSSEYVSLLALAMIDGSFDSSRADTTVSHRRHDGTPGVGQHRDAARILLNR